MRMPTVGDMVSPVLDPWRMVPAHVSVTPSASMVIAAAPGETLAMSVPAQSVVSAVMLIPTVAGTQAVEPPPREEDAPAREAKRRGRRRKERRAAMVRKVPRGAAPPGVHQAEAGA